MSDVVSLRSPLEFSRVLKNGIRRQVGGIVLIQAAGDPGPPRLGLIVSKSVGNAVTRNRVKRRLRHTVRDVRFQSGMDYVIIAHKSAAEVPHPELVGWIRRALEQSSNV
ncbi:MAG: ribonuclease P protein component [Acidimicrobiia bacterium]|nr:ribonuclease P protein component [Acidimicrobiia bacterium]